MKRFSKKRRDKIRALSKQPYESEIYSRSNIWKVFLGGVLTVAVLSVGANNYMYNSKNEVTPPLNSSGFHHELPESSESYKPTIQSHFNTDLTDLTDVDRKHLVPVQLFPSSQQQTNSTIKVVMIDDFLSPFECDSLRSVHEKHVKQLSNDAPILCFESVSTLNLHLKQAKIKVTASQKDFVPGTSCLNASLSAQVADWLNYNWSYSTAFYPGESQFSNRMAQLIEKTTGLMQNNGGKFQITSYPLNIGYKKHTDCTLESVNKRDRYATVLVYLDDVARGGETSFTELGVSVKPKKGRALVWNNMDTYGNCLNISVHQANQVVSGAKYILQRWYYYESFRSLGKRVTPPSRPERSHNQAMVLCDYFHAGSCRWYDEWSYEVINEYNEMSSTLI